MKKSIGILSSVLMATSLLSGPTVLANGESKSNQHNYIDEVEINDTFSSANQTLTNKDYVHGTFSKDDKDFYKVQVTGEGYHDLAILLSQEDGRKKDMKMHANVYNSDKQEIHPFHVDPTFRSWYLVQEGTYYIEASDLANMNNGKKYELNAYVPKENEGAIYRISGTDRYETAAKIAINSRAYGRAEHIVLASGENFPDALAGSPLAYHLDAELLLTQKDKLPEATESALKSFETKKVTIVGGTGAVSEDVEDTLETKLGIEVDRISGKDRYATAAAIASKLPNTNKAVVAYGSNFPDALSIAPYAAKSNMPILLTDTKRIPEATATALKAYEGTLAVGGTGVISEKVFKELPDAERISGKDRYSTSVAIAEYFDWPTPSSNLATGASFADALAGSVYSAKQSAPLLLTPKDELHAATKDYYQNNRMHKYTLLGGKGVLSEGLYEELASDQIKHTSEINEDYGFRIGSTEIIEVPSDEVPYIGGVVPLNPDEPTDENGIVQYNQNGELYYHPLKIGRYAKSFLISYEQTNDEAFLEKAILHGDKLLEVADEYNGGLYFPYENDFDLHGFGEDIMEGTWYSAMAQGQILSSFTRLYQVTGEEKYLDAAHKTFQSLKNLRSENDVWVSMIDDEGYLWLEEFPREEPTYALNGFLFAIFGVYDYYLLQQDEETERYLQGAITTVKHYLPVYRVEGEVSYYCRDHHVQSVRYHMIHIEQLEYLHQITGDPYFEKQALNFKQDYDVEN
ncbi:cell wall-binding repeat-containing protein [Alkalihalobacillus sp. CinArs1]|uniref:cell wall-binding repeat-containing protein n=1 Tax=Alkalihalobacillus sp. CinArs1 TaxID=2995314 RepID=UPI0022DD45E6|nr:cell wall-binding repeat-containing protein [Alkalihalobacillus sp. CinArs1]